MARTRKPEYNRGFDDAIDSALQILSVGIEMYPRVPTEKTIALFIDPEVGVKILEKLGELNERINAEVKTRMEAAAR